MSTRIFLVGLPASGKSSFAKKLAEEIGLPFLDLDNEIVASSGCSIPEIFKSQGEDHFRVLERDQLRKVIAENDQFVLATGGGTPCFFDNMDNMNANGTTIYLNASLEKIKGRLKDDETRPLMKKYDITALHKKRKPWYELAHHTVSSYAQVRSLFSKK